MAKRADRAVTYEALVQAIVEIRHHLINWSVDRPPDYEAAHRLSSQTVARLRDAGIIRWVDEGEAHWELVPEKGAKR